MNKVNLFRELIAWQKAMDLVVAVYGTNRAWPDDERFGLISQVRRAAVSVASNIAEGHGRRNDKELARFLMIAHGSLMEALTQLEIACRLGYCNQAQLAQLFALGNEVGKLINGLHVRATNSANPIPGK